MDGVLQNCNHRLSKLQGALTSQRHMTLMGLISQGHMALMDRRQKVSITLNPFPSWSLAEEVASFQRKGC